MHNYRRHSKHNFWLLLAVALLVLCVHPSPTQAQRTIDMQRGSRLIYKQQPTISLITPAVWDSSSQWFWTWELQYNTQTGQVNQNPTDHPPHSSQIELPTTTLAAFGIDTSEPDHPRSYYSVSPNGEYVAYSVVINDGVETPIYDTECMPREILIGHIPSLTIKAIDLQVHTGVEYDWFGDNAGLLISSDTPCGGSRILYAYITALFPKLTSINVAKLFPGNVSVDGIEIEIVFDRVAHISRDGSQVLLLGVNYPTANWGETVAVLLLLDTKIPSKTRILFQGEQIPNNAFFKYGDETKLLIITADGFVEYDSNTAQITMLDNTFNGITERSEAGGGLGLTNPFNDEHYVFESTISPNGRWLIYSHLTFDDLNASYYVVDLAEALYANDVAGNATPTDLPTFTPVCSSNRC